MFVPLLFSQSFFHLLIVSCYQGFKTESQPLSFFTHQFAFSGTDWILRNKTLWGIFSITRWARVEKKNEEEDLEDDLKGLYSNLHTLMSNTCSKSTIRTLGQLLLTHFRPIFIFIPIENASGFRVFSCIYKCHVGLKKGNNVINTHRLCFVVLQRNVISRTLNIKKITYFMLLVSFYTPWKHQKTTGFLMFLGGIERNQWHIMV